MSSKINTILSPLAAEYLKKKKQASQGHTPMSFNKQVTQNSPEKDNVLLSSEQPDVPATQYTEDTVTLSAGQLNDNSTLDRAKPSQPVTLEEKQALISEFSIHV
jgi:hypothetical protein